MVDKRIGKRLSIRFINVRLRYRSVLLIRFIQASETTRNRRTMRGVPNRFVNCISCRTGKGCAKDSLCHRCRLLRRPNSRRRFVWTPELDQALVRTYQTARTRIDLSGGLDHIQRQTGFTRVVITSRAGALGLSFVQRRKWEPFELRFIEENAGTLSASVIARRLKRTHYSVKAKVAQSGLRLRVREGYSRDDIRTLLGVRAARVREWIEKGWLALEQERVTERSMRQFLVAHPEEYKLNRVDEAWYKGTLFPTFGLFDFFQKRTRIHQSANGLLVEFGAPAAGSVEVANGWNVCIRYSEKVGGAGGNRIHSIM